MEDNETYRLRSTVPITVDAATMHRINIDLSVEEFYGTPVIVGNSHEEEGLDFVT